MKKAITLSLFACVMVLSVVFSIPFLSSCTPPCDQFFDIESRSTISFVIFDKNRFIFDVYPIDSFRVYFNNQPFQTFSTSKESETVTLTEIYDEVTDQAAFTSQVCKEFVFRYLATEGDTVKICFVGKPDGNCGNEFYVRNVFYNGKDLGTAFPRTLNR